MKETIKTRQIVIRTLESVILVITVLIAVLLVWIMAGSTAQSVADSPVLTALITLFVLLAIFIVVHVSLSWSGSGKEKAESTENMDARSRKDLQNQADRDDLTNVYNRRALMEYLNTIDPSSEYTVLLMNVDKFKDINEVYGYDFGDHVLQVIANELMNYMKDYNGFVARYGSDEFLIIFMGMKLSEGSELISHMRDIIHEPIRIGLASIIPTVCIGCAYSDGTSSAKEIVNRAEIAERDAKRLGRKSFVFFSKEMQSVVERTTDIKSKIQEAIQEDGFYMVYQPKVRADNKELTGYEALVRMKKYQISPAEFIPIAEENGWLRQIGRITTEKTIQQIAEWRKQDPAYDLPVSINFSSVQIRDEGYFYFVLDCLSKYQVPAGLLEIELTERVMLSYTTDVINLMNRFHTAGIRLAMDDFGTGYSSLSYLTQFPLDIIKIDRSFVSVNINDPKRRMLIADMIKLGHDLGTEIVVEGVETQQQYEYVRKMNADMIQGFYFSTPLLPEEAIAFQAA